MTANAVVAGTFADLKTVKSRSVVQMVIEIPIERGASVVEMFGFPQPGAEVPVAVARLIDSPKAEPQIEAPAAPAKPPAEKPKRTWDEFAYSEQAFIKCGDQEFRNFLAARKATFAHDAESAAVGVRSLCRVKSRSEFDTDESAAQRWRVLHGEFTRWRSEQIGQAEAEAQARAYSR